MGNQQMTVGDAAVCHTPFLEGLERIGGMGVYQLWKRFPSGQEYEQYNVYSGQGARLESDRQIYQFRKRQCLGLVAVEHFDIVTNPYSCPGYQQLRVFTERIQLRVKDLQHLPLAYGIYIIKETLVGFKAILSHFGYMPITDNLIGFNRSSRVKVWVNPNFGSNEPHSCLKVQQGIGSDEQNMLSQLFESVEGHMTQTQDVLRFRTARMLVRDSLDFQSAGIFLANFCIENRILLPQKFEVSMLKQNIKPYHERESSAVRQSSRIKTYSDASCTSSLKSGQPLKFRSSIRKAQLNGDSQDGSSFGRLTFRKKISSSQPKLKLQAFASPKHIPQQKINFTDKKDPQKSKESTQAVGEFNLPNNTSQPDTSEKSKPAATPLLASMSETPTNAKHLTNGLSGKDRIIELHEIRINSENRARKPGFFANQYGGRNSVDMCDFQEENKNCRNKPLTFSCQPTLSLKHSADKMCRSGLPVHHQRSVSGSHNRTSVSFLQSPQNKAGKLTSSILVPEMHSLPFIHIINPDGDVLKKRSDDSDCQATNIYNSSNTLDPSVTSPNEKPENVASFKTNKFEDGILSSFVADPQPPKHISFQNVKNVVESIIESSPRNIKEPGRNWELDRFSSEPRISKYSLFNEKEVFVSQIIKDEQSPRKVSRNLNFDTGRLQGSGAQLGDYPDSPCLQNFFAENKLDYEKYKLIMQNREQRSELKQSITYEELGRACEKSRIMDRDNTPMQLDRFAKREVTKSMTIDEQMLQHSMETQPKMLASIIIPYEMEAIQENETEALGS